MKTETLDGQHITYEDQTEFVIQIGRHRSAYTTRYTFKGQLARAVHYYNAINIGKGYKKRLLMPGAKRPVLARASS